MIFLQCLPEGSLAAPAAIKTPSEIAAALQRTGLADGDSRYYHDGMEFTEHMSAMQVVGWIENYYDENVDPLVNTFEDYHVALGELPEDRRASLGQDSLDLFYGCLDLLDEHVDEVLYYRDALADAASDVNTLAGQLEESSLTEKETAAAGYAVSEAIDRMENLMDEIGEKAGTWARGFGPWEELEKQKGLTGVYEAVMDLLDRIDALVNTGGRAAARTMTVSADAVRVAPDQTLLSRIARLSPISSALADADKTMKVTVLDDKYFAVCVTSGKQPLGGVEIEVKDSGVNAGEAAKVKSGISSADGGFAAFAVRDFKVGEDGMGSVDITLRKSGYRLVHAPGIWFKKGQKLNFEMEKDDGTPYPARWTFWGNDIITSDYSVVRNPHNDTKQAISVSIRSGAPYTFRMYFRDRDGGTLNVGSGSDSAETVFRFEDTWLRKVRADSKLILEITSGGKTYTHEARLVVKNSRVPFPFTDPDLKKLTMPGLHFQLPASWPKPIGGAAIDIKTPLDDKFKVRAFVDILGNGILALGTDAFDEQVKKMNDGAWKSQDQRTLDRAVKNLGEAGMLAKAKAAQGGDWAGRKKTTPFKLGKIGVDMSWFGFVQLQYKPTTGSNARLYGRGAAGFTVSVSGEVGLQWPFVSVTLGAKLSAMVYPEVGLMFDLSWPASATLPKVNEFKYLRGSLNIVLRLELSLSLTLGLKGFVSASIGGLGFLELHFRIVRNIGSLKAFLNGYDAVFDKTGGRGELEIYAGATFFVVLEILWAKTTFYPFGTLKYKLYPGPVTRVTAGRPETLADRFIAWFLSSAHADETDELEQAVQNAKQADPVNPDLDITKYHAASGRAVSPADALGIVNGDNVQGIRMRAGENAGKYPEEDLVLQLRKQSDGNRIELQYALLEPGSTDSLSFQPLPFDAPPAGSTVPAGCDVIDYAVWVMRGDQPLEAYTSADGRGTTRVMDILFTVCILSNQYQEITLEEDGQTIKSSIPRSTWARVNSYVLIRDGSSLPKLIEYRHPYVSGGARLLPPCYIDFDQNAYGPNGNPVLFGRPVTPKTLDGRTTLNDCDVVILTTPLDPRTTEAAEKKALLTTVSIPAAAGPTVTILQDPLHTFFENVTVTQNQFFPVAESSVTYPARAALFHNRGEGANLQRLAYVPAAGGTPVQLAEKVLSMATAEEGAGTPQDPKHHTVYFVQQSDDKAGYCLKSAEIYPADAASITGITVTDYDIAMPAADIQYAKLYGRGCIYWTEKVGSDRESAFVVRGLWVEENASTSIPFELGRIPVDHEKSALTSLTLAGNDEGFYTLETHTRDNASTLDVYRFGFRMTLGVKLIGNVLQDTLVAPGSYDSMIVTYSNNGNVPLTGIDLAAYRKGTGGGKDEKFETIHLDFLDPAKNRIALNQGAAGPKEVREGLRVAHPEESSLDRGLEEYRYIRISEYAEGDGHIARVKAGSREKKTLMKPLLLLPGSFGAYNISLLIPRNWSGEQEIYLKAERLYTLLGNDFSQEAGSSEGGISGSRKILSVGRNHRRRIIVGTVDNPIPAAVIPPVPADPAAPDPEFEDIDDEDIDGDGIPDDGDDDLDYWGEDDDEDGRAARKQYSDAFNTDIEYSTVNLYTEPDDLEIFAQLWEDGDEDMATLVVNNRAGRPGRGGTIVIEAFPDGEDIPVFRYVFGEDVNDRRTWSLDVPLKVLTGGRKASDLYVTVEGRDFVENGDFDNYTVLQLDTDPLVIVEQPADRKVPAGGAAVFRVAASGGRTPYFYQWQMQAPGGEWTDLEEEWEDSLNPVNIPMDFNGYRFRCVVTDDDGYSVTSAPALLTVYRVPRTGDGAPLAWWIIGAAAAAAGLVLVVLLWRSRKKEQDE